MKQIKAFLVNIGWAFIAVLGVSAFVGLVCLGYYVDHVRFVR